MDGEGGRPAALYIAQRQKRQRRTIRIVAWPDTDVHARV